MNDIFDTQATGILILKLYDKKKKLVRTIVQKNTIVKYGITEFLFTLFEPSGHIYLNKVKFGTSDSLPGNKLLENLSGGSGNTASTEVTSRYINNEYGALAADLRFTLGYDEFVAFD